MRQPHRIGKAILGSGKRALLWLLLLAAAWSLSACAWLPQGAPAGKAGPDLTLLSLPAYDDPEADGQSDAAHGAEYMPVDLFLDGTQNMGGINPGTASMYPHFGRKYREGGFHYRYGNYVGWYENLLTAFLSAMGETRVRALRYGNETVPEETLAAHGLTATDAAQRAAIWRDMHTVAHAVTPALFKSMSAEDMSGSFYALGAPAWLNRIPLLDAAALENPALASGMDAALAEAAAGIAAGDARYRLDAGAQEDNSALLSALAQIDTGRLTIITADPASIRRVSGTDAGGKPLAFVEGLLRQAGVFDQGLTVGVLDFQLDYLGQMATFTTADLSEPLLWGRVIIDERKLTFENLGVMPRRLLTLVIGTKAKVSGFIDRLDAAIAADSAFKGLRGPQNGELSYTANGQTVTQQPFTFQWNHTLIARPGMGLYTQHTPGAALQTDGAAGAQAGTASSGLPLLTLTPDSAGLQPDRTVTVRLPIREGAEGAKLDVSRLSGAGIKALSSLLLSDVLPNRPGQAATGQTIVYRDKQYVFTQGKQGDGFTLAGVRLEDGALVCELRIAGALLKPGYYRLRLSADATGEQVAWEPVDWIDGPGSVSASVTEAQIYAWETFTAAMTQYDRDAKGLPKMFAHAWGGFTDKLYHGLRVPDFPPVYRNVRLKELVDQLRAAAASDQSPLIRYAFEVYVTQ